MTVFYAEIFSLRANIHSTLIKNKEHKFSLLESLKTVGGVGNDVGITLVFGQTSL